jgi:hypothetical protein
MSTAKILVRYNGNVCILFTHAWGVKRLSWSLLARFFRISKATGKTDPYSTPHCAEKLSA